MRPTVRGWRIAALATSAAVLAGGCAQPGDGGEPSAAEPVRLTVLAAASLAPAVEAAAEQAEAARPGLDVAVSAGASSALVQQVLDGLPADVVITADEATMARLDGRTDGPPRPIASNRVVLAVPAGNPAGVTALADLADPAVRSGRCAPQVPCGRLAGEWFAAAGVTPRPVTEEPDVGALTAKLAAGELDAGVVYATDVAASDGRLVEVPVAQPPAPRARATAAVLTAPDAPSQQRAAARGFVAELARPDGALAAAGFGPP